MVKRKRKTVLRNMLFVFMLVSCAFENLPFKKKKKICDDSIVIPHNKKNISHLECQDLFTKLTKSSGSWTEDWAENSSSKWFDLVFMWES